MDDYECCCWISGGLIPSNNNLIPCHCSYGSLVAAERSRIHLSPISPSSIELADSTRSDLSIDETLSIDKADRAEADNLIEEGLLGAKWIREITLTQPAESKDPYDLLNTMRRIVQSAMFSIVWWLACIELTDKGTPHIHMLIGSNAKYFNASKIKYFHKYRFECAPVRDIKKYIEYIYKEKNDRLHIEFCLQKGIDQFYGTNHETKEQETEKRPPATGCPT